MHGSRASTHAVRAFNSREWRTSSHFYQANPAYERDVHHQTHMQVQAHQNRLGDRLDLRAIVQNLSTGLKNVDRVPVSGSGLAAVLVPLFEDETGTVRVLLTERSAKLPTHAGEVSFPGGKRDPDDADDIATALREAHEETGLSASDVEVVACCSPFLSKHMLSVTPVIATIRPDFKAIPNPAEVESVFSMPLERVLKARGHQHKDVRWQEWEYRVHYFDYEGYNVWGLTAAILIHIAKIAFQTRPEFEERCPSHPVGQPVFDGKGLILRPLASPALDPIPLPDPRYAPAELLGPVKM